MYQGQSYSFDSVVPEVLASGIANSFATFQAPTGALIGAGQPDPDGWVDVEGYVGIVCMDAPTSDSRITANEKKSEAQIESDNSSHVWLAGFYPEIATHTEWRIIITDELGNQTTGDVVGSESDSQCRTTRVQFNVATV